MKQRGFLLLAVLACGAMAGGGLTEHAASAAAGEPSLRDTLAKGLRASRPDEFAFVDQVITMVQANTLPREMVMGTFMWARRHHPEVPFPYFQQALLIRAHRAGIPL